MLGMAPAPELIRRRARITGRVQGVGFRESCRREAAKVGVTGTVRNLGDGAVEAVFEGPADRVELMLLWSRRGPRMAHVRHLDITAEPPTGTAGFTIT
jgi:acylphosphatase